MARCRRRKFKIMNHAGDIFASKDARSDFFKPRFSNAFQTVCDVDIHPEDKIKYSLGKEIRHVGSGAPFVKALASGKGLKTSHPCTYDVLMMHEQVHVDNAKANCKGFKKCLDDEVANNLVYDTVSPEEFRECQIAHHNGLAESCVQDEKQAYALTVTAAEAKLKDANCASEKSTLEANLKMWKKYAIKPPNC